MPHRISPRRRAFAIALVLVFAFAGTAASQSPTSTGSKEPAPLSFRVVVDQVTALFPAIRTDVIEVTGRRVTLASGRADGVQRGVELVAFREGRELYHPTTKKLLGRVEDLIGRIVVTEVSENYSIATQVDGAPVQPGDKARVSSGKVPLTVVTLSGAGPRPRVVEAATYDLVQEFERTGRFQVGLGDPIAVWLAQEKISMAEFLSGRGVKEAAERFKVQNLLALGFTQVEGKPYMDVRLFSGDFQTPHVTTALLVPASVGAKPAQGFSSTGGPGGVKTERRSLLARLLSGNFESTTYSAGAASIPLKSLATFPFMITSMDVAVAPADRTPRIAITDGQRVFLYRLKEQTLEPEWTHDRLSVGKILSVQLADLDGDGVLEVVVNRQDYKAGMIGYILTTDNGRPKLLVDDIAVLMLAVDENGDGVNRTLLAQSYNKVTFYNKGPATRYVLRGKDIVPSGSVPTHDTFRATGATFSNIGGKDGRVLAFVDENNRLKIVANGQEVWRSLTVVGGGLAMAHVQQFVQPTFVDTFFKLEPNPVSVDLDGDGVQEIVVPINEDEAGKMAVVFRGPVGYRLQVVSSGFEGMVTGLGAVPGDGAPSLIAAVVKRLGMFRQQGETQLIMTLPE